MAETFSVSEFVLPGTYVRVRAEGLIGVGGISTGNIGIVGTARRMEGNNNVLDYARTYNFSDYETARTTLGPYDALAGGKLHLTRALEVAFRNGARNVYARPLNLGSQDAQPGTSAYTSAFNEVIKEDVNIILAPQLSTADALSVLGPILESAENASKDLMAVVGADGADVSAIRAQVVANDRMIMTVPGFQASETVVENNNTVSRNVNLPVGYSAAAVAGLIGTLAPQQSPTNKVLTGVTTLTTRYAYGELKDLVSGGLLVLEQRQGVRVVRGVTTEMASNGPFRQVTTRRIVDFAKAGIRQAANPFIGRLNNERVRKALRGAIDGFLTTMVGDEQLIGYTLEVTATRPDEIAGRAMVNVVLQPTFSIDFIAVTLVLE